MAKNKAKSKPKPKVPESQRKRLRPSTDTKVAPIKKKRPKKPPMHP